MTHRRSSTLLALILTQACVAAESDRSGDMFRGSQSVDDRSDTRPTMSLETLRTCVALEDDTRQLRRDVDSAQLSLELAERDFRAIDHQVQTLKQTLDLEDGRAVDNYNGKVEEHGRALDAFNARVEPYNHLLEPLDSAIARFNDKCTLPYLERDMLTVRVEREAAIRAQIEAEQRP